MSGDVIAESRSTAASSGSAVLRQAIASADLGDTAVTVVGYGAMGREHVKAVRAIGVGRIRVCSRSAGPIEELNGMDGVQAIAGGIERLEGRAEPGELGIVATPVALLVPVSRRLAALGFRRLLIEKPVALRSEEIEQLAQELERHGVDAVCAYNRVAYPSFHEAKACAQVDGGITSCTYTMTEWITQDWTQRYPAEVLGRWGIANSLHVMSLAHGLIGWPAQWSGYHAGGVDWHPTGSVFAGAGLSQRKIPFAYHADWTSTGRWSVEVHTPRASYRLCPLEQLFRRTSALGGWEPVPVEVFAPQVKAGLAEQVAAILRPEIRAGVSLVSLREAARLVRFGESVFGYAER